MIVWVSEYLTGGGLHATSDPAELASLVSEGRGMLEAIVADLLRVPGVSVAVPWDDSLGNPPDLPADWLPTGGPDEYEAVLRKGLRDADSVILVAPECDGILSRLVRLVSREAPDKLLSASRWTVELGSSKTATLEHFRAHGLRVPRGWRTRFPLQRAGEDASRDAPLPFPLIVKPDDGAGSCDATLLADIDALRHTRAAWRTSQRMWRVEQCVSGLAASVVCVAGPRRVVLLPPMEQLLRWNPGPQFVGCRGPLRGPLAERAWALVEQAVGCMPEATGVFGFDLVLHDSDPAEDVLIELNPRHTSSYVALREVCDVNLAGLLIELNQGPLREPIGETRKLDRLEAAADRRVAVSQSTM